MSLLGRIRESLSRTKQQIVQQFDDIDPERSRFALSERKLPVELGRCERRQSFSIRPVRQQPPVGLQQYAIQSMDSSTHGPLAGGQTEDVDRGRADVH